MKYKPISIKDLMHAMADWESFWGAPYPLRNNIADRRTWAQYYLTGLNSSGVARKHWDSAKDRVYAVCDRFPWPKDVIAAAAQIDNQRDVAEQNAHKARKHVPPKPKDAATKAEVSEMVENFLQTNGEKS